MKKIKIKSAGLPDKSSHLKEGKKFTIFLGNGITMYFTTVKDKNYALAEINRRLNAILFELNEMYIFLFGEYRRLWFYMINESMMRETKIHESNSEINRNFALLTERSHWVNGNVFSFKNIEIVMNNLEWQIEALAEIRRDKKQYIEYHLLQTKRHGLDIIRDALKNLNITGKYSSRGYSKENGFNQAVLHQSTRNNGSVRSPQKVQTYTPAPSGNG